MFYEYLRSQDSDYFNINYGGDKYFPIHIHSSIEIIYVVSGCVMVSINKNTKVIGPGEAYLCPPYSLHGFDSENGWNYILMNFSQEFVSDIDSFFNLYRFDEYFLEKDDFLKETMYNAVNCFENKYDEYMIKGYIYFIFSILTSKLRYSDNSDNSKLCGLQKALIYIQNNYEKNINLSYISDKLGITRTYLSKLINNNLNMNFNDYINLHRVYKAKELLSNTQKSITEISYEIGYDSLRTFERVFKKQCNLTPNEFRIKAKNSKR